MNNFASGVYVVRPTRFILNEETALDDHFMEMPKDMTPEQVSKQAIKEHQNFVENLEDNGIRVTVFEQPSDEAADAVFPDWFTTHRHGNFPEGIFILYPMYYKSRRAERTDEVVDKIQ